MAHFKKTAFFRRNRADVQKNYRGCDSVHKTYTSSSQIKKKTAQRRGSGHRVLLRVKKVFTMMASRREKQSNKQVFFTREVVGGKLGDQMVSVNQTPWFSVSFFL